MIIKSIISDIALCGLNIFYGFSIKNNKYKGATVAPKDIIW